MLTKYLSLILICSATLVFSCQNNKSSQPDEQLAALKLPKTPEAAIKVWEESVNNNEFDIPRQISKGEVLELVNSVAKSNAEEKLGVSQLKILNIECQKDGEFAHCTCNLINDKVKQSFKYSLVNENNQWYLTSVDDNDNSTASRKSITSPNPL